MKEFLDIILISIGAIEISISDILRALVGILICFIINLFVLKSWLPTIYSKYQILDTQKKRLRRIIGGLFLLSIVIVVVYSLGLNLSIWPTDRFDFKVNHIMLALFVLQLSRVLDWLAINVFIPNYTEERISDKALDDAKGDNSLNSNIKYIIYTLAILFILNVVRLDFSLFDFSLENGEKDQFYFSNIFIAILIILLAKLAIWVITRLTLINLYRRKRVEIGIQFAINQLIKYVIYTVAIIAALDSMGINMTLILGGAAALLVGIGLGLQQTFNDFISGIVLLFERSVAVGDILEIDQDVGIVKRIGLRSSIIETRGNKSLLIPNSKLVNENVINWTHYNNKVRFRIKIGVAYGADTSIVEECLLKAVHQHKKVLEFPEPSVLFEDFGDSALQFSLYFFSREYMGIEKVKSDIRFTLDALFRENNINIPFPQTDVWLRKD